MQDDRVQRFADLLWLAALYHAAGVTKEAWPPYLDEIAARHLAALSCPTRA